MLLSHLSISLYVTHSSDGNTVAALHILLTLILKLKLLSIHVPRVFADLIVVALESPAQRESMSTFDSSCLIEIKSLLDDPG